MLIYTRKFSIMALLLIISLSTECSYYGIWRLTLVTHESIKKEIEDFIWSSS